MLGNREGYCRRGAGLWVGLGLYQSQNWGAGWCNLKNRLVEYFSNLAVIRIALRLPFLLYW